MSRQPHRMPSGGLIDRSKPLEFSFDGKTYQGYAGDTLASALLANGVKVVGRSFKHHRPRGVLAAGVEEPNALMQLGTGARTEPNIRATDIELTAGLAARAVNCWPSAAFDLGAVNGLASPFIPAGFYYKTFLWPRWELYEGFIRRAAGLGRAPAEPDPDRYEHRYAHCDVLVVGAGAAGLAAASAASAGGARVILCEQDRMLGGRLLWDPAAIEGGPGADWVAKTAAVLCGRPEVQVLTRATAVGYFDHNALAIMETLPNGNGAQGPRMRLWQVRAKQVVLATGALERPIVFPGNDRPGVMLAGAVQQYLARYAVRCGRRAVVFTNNDDAYAAAVALAEAGAAVTLVDVRAEPPPHVREAAQATDVTILAGAAVIATHGSPALAGATVRDASGRTFRLDCDVLAMSGGFNPSLQLYCQSGGKPVYDEGRAMFTPGPSVQSERSAGAAAGVLDLAGALDQGWRAGIAAAAACGAGPPTGGPPRGEGRLAPHVQPCWRVPGAGKAFVDFQNDVTASDLVLAVRENFASVEHLKRYTTLGMATDQGKTSNVNALAILAGLTGRPIAQVGTTRDRFAYTPVPLGLFAGAARGDLFKPIRRLPMHDWHAGHGAAFEDFGGWRRPSAYLRPGESAHAAEQREARAVRERVGLFDASPLGKIEVAGPDAGVFLDRIYANAMSRLAVGQVRYGLMLNELGVVIDDGVCARLAEDRFLVSTTGTGAERIAVWLEEWRQCEWPDLQVITAPITTAWAVLTLSGPKARAVLASLVCGMDLAPEAFPHMSFREGEAAGAPVRVFRVSFTGETSYEIHAPAAEGPALWERLVDAGRAHGLEPVGVEAWMLLRTEKGYLHMGADTDGSTAPDDIGWGRVTRRKGDFVGKRSLTRPENLRADRLQFVGLEALEGGVVLPVGAHVLGDPAAGGVRQQGYVTSSGLSPALGRGVALGMVRGGRARVGELVTLSAGDRRFRARITAPGAYDPEGARLHG
ncbi:MAG TPA: sarcosine oxidase subunit alpha family protein [Phenylobacterium sp.]|nr:sarcosine oxidase subunit alpha family protein [Phenylobacterium sp.]